MSYRSISHVAARHVALRRVDCKCGFPWLATPTPGDPLDVCPKCASPPRRGTVGPVKDYDLSLPLIVSAAG